MPWNYVNAFYKLLKVLSKPCNYMDIVLQQWDPGFKGLRLICIAVAGLRAPLSMFLDGALCKFFNE